VIQTTRYLTFDNSLGKCHQSWSSPCHPLSTTAARERMGQTEDAEEAEWAEKIKSKKANLHHSWVEKEHPGCEISGYLLVDRVPVGSALESSQLAMGDSFFLTPPFSLFVFGTRTGQLPYPSTLPAPRFSPTHDQCLARSPPLVHWRPLWTEHD
jgi:hypothetical protein